MQTTTRTTPEAASVDCHACDAPARLPALSSEDRHLLHNFIAFREDPIALAKHSDHAYLDIIDFTSRPDITLWINHIRTLRARNLRDRALAELEHCLQNSRDPIERRRAATTILRATDPNRMRRSSSRQPHSRLASTPGSAPKDTAEVRAEAHQSEYPGNRTSPHNGQLASCTTGKPVQTAAHGIADGTDTSDASDAARTDGPAPQPVAEASDADALQDHFASARAVQEEAVSNNSTAENLDDDNLQDDDFDEDDPDFHDEDDLDEDFDPAAADELLTNPAILASVKARLAERFPAYEDEPSESPNPSQPETHPDKQVDPPSAASQTTSMSADQNSLEAHRPNLRDQNSIGASPRDAPDS